MIHCIFQNIIYCNIVHINNLYANISKCFSLLAYIQEIGRAGRSGNVVEAVLYFNRTDLGVQTFNHEERKYTAGTLISVAVLSYIMNLN